MPWRSSMGLLEIPGFLLTLLMGFVLIADTIELLKSFIGSLAYVVWIFVVPIFAPAGFFLPWFDAWVFGGEVNPVVFWLWVAWLVPLVILTSIMVVSSGIRMVREKGLSRFRS